MAFFLPILALAALATALVAPDLGSAQALQTSAFGLAAIAGLLWLRQVLAGRRATAGRILIDGSNLMHWNNGTPDITVVRDVARALATKGYEVGVIFDANAGYKIADRYMNEATLARKLGLNKSHVLVSPKGQPADGFLLQAAREMDAPIVTNDRFRDWHESFPEFAQPGRLLHGGYRDGAPYLRPGKGKPPNSAGALGQVPAYGNSLSIALRLTDRPPNMDS
ncbi:NYN domain-containing protein [Marimonas lutisalis]|uniref:NYN domain-containing protein n=1 Tax=Marimonas lutisalis TaxID=2545756 RepID=UPI0010F55725|nr:hypothetical protein [Marimonas lutisalis]